MKKFIFFFLISALGVFALNQVHADKIESDASQTVRIVATTAQIGDLVRHVVGDFAEIDVLIGEGLDPHLYRPSRTDRLQMQQASTIFYNGLTLEGKMQDLLLHLEKEKTVLAVAKNVSKENLLQNQGAVDPHIWMNVKLWSEALDIIAETLSEKYPGQTEIFQANAAQYKQRLEKLDHQMRNTFQNIPAEKRILVTAHDAFNYLGETYGLEVVGIQGISTESEAGLHHVENLVNMLVQHEIPAVFVETSVSDRNIRALIEGAAAQGHEVRIGGELFSDSMGAPGTQQGTYIGMMQHNAEVISQALAGPILAN